MSKKLYELLAAEKTATSQRDALWKDTIHKFERVDGYFAGHVKTLTLIEDSPQKDALEAAARQDKELVTTVPETLAYYLNKWSKTEDLLYQKNVTNTKARADIVFQDTVLASNVPVDELMGLEARLSALRSVILNVPTLDSSRQWIHDIHAAKKGVWVTAQSPVTAKTEKVVTPVVLYEATKEHPAQVKEVSSDKVVGSFTEQRYSGCAQPADKAKALAVIDDLLMAVKAARTRANDVIVDTGDKIGDTLTRLILECFTVLHK